MPAVTYSDPIGRITPVKRINKTKVNPKPSARGGYFQPPKPGGRSRSASTKMTVRKKTPTKNARRPYR